MCGIAGFVGTGDILDLQEMNKSLAHRGPDAAGVWTDTEQAVFLGHRRLSVIDLTGGAQPMWTRDGDTGIVFNGEIYNHAELRLQLEALGYVFSTDHSDTEVLLHGYREWGYDVTSRLNGMWAFAIYERSKGVIFCSRDRFGKKPFFYTQTANLFAFASELTALCRHRHIRLKISTTSLQKYFAYGFIPSPNSLYEGIHKLPAGHSLVFHLQSRKITLRKYWELLLEPFEERPANAEEEWCENIRELLARAVKRRLISDVPLGVFLSGGLDSSAITAFASHSHTTDRLDTFSIGFDEADFDESDYAELMARIHGTWHRKEILSLDKAREILPDIAAQIDEPLGDSSLLPTYLLCRYTRKYVTVALSGDGGDELFAGYAPFRALKAAALYSRLVHRPIHTAISAAIGMLPVSHNYMSLDFKLKRTLRGLGYPCQLWNPVWLGPLEHHEIEELFNQPIDLDDLYSEAIDVWDACGSSSLIDKTLQFYTRLYLQDDILVKADRASMLNSLEVRSPFLDIELVDFVRRIPSCYKLRNGETKYILKKAMQPLLPKSILRRGKQGFAIPVGKWFKSGYLHIDGAHPLLNADITRRFHQEHVRGRSDHRLFLWSQWFLNAAVTNAIVHE